MSETAQLSGVPPKIWDMLNVDPQQRMAECWAGWPIDTRIRLLKLARSEQADTRPDIPWRSLDDADRAKVIEVLSRCRSLYIATDLSTNWRHVVNAMNAEAQ